MYDSGADYYYTYGAASVLQQMAYVILKIIGDRFETPPSKYDFSITAWKKGDK